MWRLLTQHPIDPRRLPDVVRERLARDMLEKGRLFHGGLPADARELIWTMHIEALRPLVDPAKIGCMLFVPAVNPQTGISVDYLRELRERLPWRIARRRVPRRRLNGDGSAEPHAEAAKGSRPANGTREIVEMGGGEAAPPLAAFVDPAPWPCPSSSEIGALYRRMTGLAQIPISSSGGPTDCRREAAEERPELESAGKRTTASNSGVRPAVGSRPRT